MGNRPFPGTPTRRYQNIGVGDFQYIHDTKYATRSIAAGTLPVVTNFFGAAPSVDITLDRYEQGNTLVSSGKVFTIFGIAVQLTIGAAGTLTDLEKICNFTCLRLITAQKEYGMIPLYMLPQGGGLAIQSGQIAVTPAASPGAFSTVGATNGMPQRSSMFNLAMPLDIQANQSFYAELVAPSGQGFLAAQSLTGAVQVRVVLDGVEQRAAA